MPAASTVPSRAARGRPLQVDIAWDPDALQGAALGASDALRVVNELAAMRGRRGPAVTWRWRVGPGRRPPASLPQPPRPALAPTATGRGVPDLLLVPGWLARSGPHLHDLVSRHPWLADLANRTHAAGGSVVGMHTGVVLLASAGLLAGREAVVPWPFVPTLMRVASGVRLRGDCAWTVQDRVWTADSPALAVEVLLDALAQAPGAATGGRRGESADGDAGGLADLARAAAQVLLHSPERQQAGAQLLREPLARRVPPGAVERARRHLEAHLDAPYDLPQLAAAAATSPRTLLRHFEASLGKTPLAYLQGLRMARARVLLETTYLPVEHIAQACGFAHVGTFRRQFTRATEQTPADYRERHRLRVRRPAWGGAQAP